MSEEGLSSGFVGEDIPADEDLFTETREFYVSANGYSQLYQCSRHGKLHIIKCLQPLYVHQELYEQLLRKEFNIGYQLEHAHICRTLGWERNERLGNCILLEYVDGITLKAFMEQGKLTRSLARKFIVEICSALQYIHSKQIVHRDLKPANILITHNGNNVKLIDFGLSDCDDYEILKIPAGTRKYLAPEQLSAEAALDCRIDIYSLGVIIGEMADLLKDRQLNKISRKCVQVDPEKRYHSVAEITEALKAGKLRKVYWYAALGVLLLGGGLMYWQTPATADAYVAGSGVTRSYSNAVVGDGARDLLLKERNRLNRRLNYFRTDPLQLEQDSLQAWKVLKKALDREFPGTGLRQSVGYKNSLRALQEELNREIQRIRRKL